MISKNQRGFTILELILSIFILSVAVAGIFSSFSLMFVLSTNNADKATAISLAKEGLEVAINIRDTNWINKVDWSYGLYPECENGCQLDYTTYTSVGVKPWIEPGDYLSITQGFYGYSATGSPTKFKRKITTTLLNNYALKIVSDVFWDQRTSVLNPLAKQGHFSSEVVIYNWQNN